MTIPLREVLLALTHHPSSQGDQLRGVAWDGGVSGMPVRISGPSLANWDPCPFCLQRKFTCLWPGEHTGKTRYALGSLRVLSLQQETEIQVGKDEKQKWPPNPDWITFLPYLFPQLRCNPRVGEGLGIPSLSSNTSLCTQPVVGVQYVLLKRYY